MIVLSILICVFLERWHSLLSPTDKVTGMVVWLASFIHRHVKAAAIFQGWLGLLIIFLPFFCLLLLIQYGLCHLWYGIPKWVFNTLVLWLCMGARPFYAFYMQPSAPFFTVLTAPFTPNNQDVGTTTPTFSTDQTVALYQQVFSVFFWFILFGAAGAFTYRALIAARSDAILAESELNGYFIPLTRLIDYLDWIPVRLLGFALALSGHFMSTFTEWRMSFLSLPAQNSTVLQRMLNAAKDLSETEVALSTRALFVWLLVLLCLYPC